MAIAHHLDPAPLLLYVDSKLVPKLIQGHSFFMNIRPGGSQITAIEHVIIIRFISSRLRTPRQWKWHFGQVPSLRTLLTLASQLRLIEIYNWLAYFYRNCHRWILQTVRQLRKSTVAARITYDHLILLARRTAFAWKFTYAMDSVIWVAGLNVLYPWFEYSQPTFYLGKLYRTKSSVFCDQHKTKFIAGY